MLFYLNSALALGTLVCWIANAALIPHQHLHELVRRAPTHLNPCHEFPEHGSRSSSDDAKLFAASTTECLYTGRTNYTAARFMSIPRSGNLESRTWIEGQLLTLPPRDTDRWLVAETSNDCAKDFIGLYDTISSVLLDLIINSGNFLNLLTNQSSVEASGRFRNAGSYNVRPQLNFLNKFFDLRSGFIEVDAEWKYVRLNLDRLDQLRDEASAQAASRFRGIQPEASLVDALFYPSTSSAEIYSMSGSLADVSTIPLRPELKGLFLPTEEKHNIYFCPDEPFST
ncbi:hypothetical protein FRB96_006739 [Tulasnella sp. 330]|nr:hypothetical protein FRB96_006739 [Tulasnella sp. 330]